MTPNVVLDLDGSVGEVPERRAIDLHGWQERLRFGCRISILRAFAAELARCMPARHGTVFLGSGDFHHLSWPLIARVRPSTAFDVVVLDNHPDNMRYAFGVHCGSWVRSVAALPAVRHVHVLGISSPDITARRAWENYLLPLRSGKLSYWSVGVDVAWANRLGLGHAFLAFDDPDAMIAAFVRSWRPRAAYLSVDKDVFAPHVAQTNWDQGRLELRHAAAVIDALRSEELLGSDITGEISVYRYRSWLKRRLSAMDAQPEVDAARLDGWQAQQHSVNLQLLAALSGNGRSASGGSVPAARLP